MYVIHHAHLLAQAAHDSAQWPAGGPHFPAAGPPGAGDGFQVWVHLLPPGGQSPVLRHAGELLALAMSGGGKLLVGGGPLRFQAPCTLIAPRDTDFQIVNNAAVPLQLVLVFTQPPVTVAADGG